VLDGIPMSDFHNGGRVAFGPDGMLYVTTGDATERGNATDPDSLGGKILRVTPEGEPAPGNPTEGSPVWTSGHRNVQGIAWDDEDRLWASEFGQDTWDELNVIEPGNDYGWPDVEGRADKQGVVDPQVQWSPEDASPSGVAFANGAVWMAGLRGARLWRIEVSGGTVGVPRATVVVLRAGEKMEATGEGDGMIDATCKAIKAATGVDGTLTGFNVSAVTGGVDALGDVIVQLEAGGIRVSGRGVSTDVVEASARAYLSAVNKVLRIQARAEVRQDEVGP